MLKPNLDKDEWEEDVESDPGIEKAESLLLTPVVGSCKVLGGWYTEWWSNRTWVLPESSDPAAAEKL